MEAGLLDAAPIWSNLKTFNAAPFRGRIHGILGGYPCQPFSNSGLRRGESDPRHLYPFISRCIKKSRPIWCFFENVEGHISLGFESVQKDLRKMGYSVEAGLYSAAEAGAPHRRNRLFILAVEKSYLIGMRGRNLAAANGECEIQAQGSGSMAIASSSGLGGVYEPSLQPEAIGGCDLANTGRNGPGSTPESRPEEQQKEGPEEHVPGSQLAHSDDTWQSQLKGCQSESGEWSINRGEVMADKLRQSLAERREQSTREEQQAIKRGDRWPSQPGQPQFEWEEPRVSWHVNRLPSSIRAMWSKYRSHFAKVLGEKVWSETEFRIKAHFESGLGCTVNGYNFREDFLRALGNSVVEQTAEIAFKDLTRKHGIELRGR
jgi:DNA (cytosine-5)-methyltransferase 1